MRQLSDADKRREIANILFDELHNSINKSISQTAQDILKGAEIHDSLRELHGGIMVSMFKAWASVEALDKNRSLEGENS